MKNGRGNLRVTFLGGLDEVGLNFMVLECDGSAVVFDCGVKFPDDEMPGIDLVVPDFTYLESIKETVTAYVLTHGHEDHIGALPFALKRVNAPVFGTAFTLGLVRNRIEDSGLKDPVDLREVNPGKRFSAGPFVFEPVRVAHSIVQSVAYAIETPQGLLVHTGDFKIDPTPVGGEATDIASLAEFGRRGVLALFSDSTNSEKAGYSLSEAEIGRTFEDIFDKARGRLIFTVFASNIHRIRQLMDISARFGRKVHLTGRSVQQNVKLARELDLITFPDSLLASPSEAGNGSPRRLTVIAAGSQAEPNSAVTKLANGDHPDIEVKDGDTVVFSSRFIPGNERAIYAAINSLLRRGARVVYEAIASVHTSGHAYNGEQQMMLGVVKPQYFIPVHGEMRHLTRHADLALTAGIPEKNVIIASDGDVIEFEDGACSIRERVPCGRVLIDESRTCEIDEDLLRERRRMAGCGIVVCVLTVERGGGRVKILSGPDIRMKGMLDPGPGMLDRAREKVAAAVSEAGHGAAAAEIEEIVRRTVRSFFKKTLERPPPLVFPFLIER